jgi:hypothetical protein
LHDVNKTLPGKKQSFDGTRIIGFWRVVTSISRETISVYTASSRFCGLRAEEIGEMVLDF